MLSFQESGFSPTKKLGFTGKEQAMTEDDIQEILSSRGLDTILEEHYLTWPFVLGLLDELGYIDLERYDNDH